MALLPYNPARTWDRIFATYEKGLTAQFHRVKLKKQRDNTEIRVRYLSLVLWGSFTQRDLLSLKIFWQDADISFRFQGQGR